MRELSLIQVEKISTVPISRLGVRIGRVDDAVMAEVGRAPAAYLGLAG